MKLAKCLLVLFCLLMICETTEAQLFRGRFMQKIRDDLSGASRQKAEQQRALADQARRKQLELAQQRQKAAQARAGAKTPTPARPNTRQQSAHNQRSPQRAPQQQRPTNTNRNTAGSSSDKHRYQKAQATGVPKFGMTVTENKDGVLVITQVHPRGNAAQAGIRPGDVVAEIGSVEPGSKKEYESIVDIMSEGDQMEFVISRRGKENTLMVQFGDLPEKFATQNSWKTNWAQPSSTTRHLETDHLEVRSISRLKILVVNQPVWTRLSTGLSTIAGQLDLS